jgi:hypothetical protein
MTCQPDARHNRSPEVSMRRALLFLVVVGALAVVNGDLHACGDKYLRIGHAARSGRYIAAHPASVLLYQAPGSVAAAIKDFEKIVRAAGHKAVSVTTPAAAAAAVASGDFDVVLAGPANCRPCGLVRRRRTSCRSCDRQRPTLRQQSVIWLRHRRAHGPQEPGACGDRLPHGTENPYGPAAMTAPAVVRGAAALVLFTAIPSASAAQDPPAGEGLVVQSYQYVRSPVHLASDGAPNPDLGKSQSHMTFVDVKYGLTDRLALAGTGAWMASKWTGNQKDSHGPLDTGAFHYGLQDARAELRYTFDVGRAFVTPFVGAGGPMRPYETRGHSAFGRKLKDAQVGVAVGLPVWWRGDLHTSIGYAFVQRVKGVDFNLDRLTGDVAFGRPVGSKLWLEAACSFQWMHDGLRVPLVDHFELREVHDRFVRSSHTVLGGSASVPLSSRLDLTVGGFATAIGRGTHSVRGVYSSLSWRFGGGLELIDP